MAVPAWNLRRTRGSSEVLFALAETSSGSFFWLSSTCSRLRVTSCSGSKHLCNPTQWKIPAGSFHLAFIQDIQALLACLPALCVVLVPV